jgi:hypothetical protein
MTKWLLLVGVAQGWALWGLWKARELKIWPALDPISERALLYVSLALPLAIYLTHNIATLTRAKRTKILVGIGVLFPLLGAYSGWAENIAFDVTADIWRSPPVRPSDILAAAILGFIIIPLLAHLDRSSKRWSYSALFETAWRNAMLSASSAALTGAFWVILFAGAMLMKSIGLEFIFDLIKKPIFSLPITGLIFSTAFSLGLARAEMIVALRRFWLSISSWFLPLLMVFPVMWVIALPFTGLELLFKTHGAAFALLWFMALCIKFANAAYQDGASEQPYPHWLSKAIMYAWITLLVVAAIASWAMKLRIEQHGWTEDRVWGVFVLALASLYVVGYALAVRDRTSWMSTIGQTNIVVALVLCAGVLLLLSPLVDARRIAVNSQMSRLINGAISAEKIDYEYLRWQAGRYGQDALEKLIAGIEHKEKETISSKATQALARKERHSNDNGAQALTPKEIRQRIRVLPHGETLDEALVKKFQSPNSTHWQENQCLQEKMQCAAWITDLNDDGLKDAIVLFEKPEGWIANTFFYHQKAPGQYVFGGVISSPVSLNNKSVQEMVTAIERGETKMVAAKWKDIEIAGKRLKVIEEQCDGAACK